MPDQRSRYAELPQFAAIDGRKGTNSSTRRIPSITYGVIPTFEALGSRNYTNHLWVQGDRVDYIAHKKLGAPHLWDRIMSLNPHIPDIHAIEPGTLIRIPSRGV
jgi:hypothetical protein